MARTYPLTAAEFRRIPGVGEQKLKDFAEPFLAAIADYLQTNPRQSFNAPNGSKVQRVKLNESEAETLRRFRAGESIDQIARARGFVRNTICGHLALAVESGAPLRRELFFTPAQEKEIAAAFAHAGARNLTGVREQLGGTYDVGDLRIFRALAVRQL